MDSTYHQKFPFNLIDKSTMAYFNRPIMACTQILVHKWGPRAKILALFRRHYQKLDLSAAQATGFPAKRHLRSRSWQKFCIVWWCVTKKIWLKWIFKKHLRYLPKRQPLGGEQKLLYPINFHHTGVNPPI